MHLFLHSFITAIPSPLASTKQSSSAYNLCKMQPPDYKPKPAADFTSRLFLHPFMLNEQPVMDIVTYPTNLDLYMKVCLFLIDFYCLYVDILASKTGVYSFW